MMRPYLSIVIPHYNAPEKLERLLISLGKSKKAPPFEVIVVDDGSTVPLSFRPPSRNPENQKHGSRDKPGMTMTRIIRLPHNHGPAVARNRGVKAARGTFIVFLDCDVEVFPDTLFEIAKVFTDDPDVVALTGVWVKEQKSHDFFPNFKALRDWSYWINERNKSGYYFLFSTRIASIKKAVFERLGGFDESYPAPLVEDIELTYRIARRYAIIFAPQVRVRHEFESFWPIAKKYFLRAYFWTKLYQRRKKFDPVATTLTEAVTTVSAVAVVFFGLSRVVFTILFSSGILNTELGIMKEITVSDLFMIHDSLFIILVFMHLLLVRKFLAFVAREKGIVFAVKSFLMGLILYCFIFAGAVAGRIIHARS